MGNSLAVYWLELGTFSAMAWGSIFGQGTKIPTGQAVRQKKKKKVQIEMCCKYKIHIDFVDCYQT